MNKAEPFSDKDFWSGALRDENSTEWYWETSGNSTQDSDFHWGIEEPTMENSTGCLGIVFSPARGGNKDVECESAWVCAMCEY